MKRRVSDIVVMMLSFLVLLALAAGAANQYTYRCC